MPGRQKKVEADLRHHLGRDGRAYSAFSQALIEAKAITTKHDIRKRATAGGEFGWRNKMPYFFVVLKDLLAVQDADTGGGRRDVLEHAAYSSTPAPRTLPMSRAVIAPIPGRCPIGLVRALAGGIGLGVGLGRPWGLLGLILDHHGIGIRHRAIGNPAHRHRAMPSRR